jgi:glycosyltransferase involved in cell wall biosynthesis
MKVFNIGVLTDKFIDWGGGIDFIRLLLNGLCAIEDSEDFRVKIHIYIPKVDENKIKLKNYVKRIINKVVSNRFPYQKNVGRSFFVKLFKAINNDIEIVFYDGSEKHLSKLTLERSIDFLLPAFVPLSSDFPIEWAGYIFDFQHRYYPEFFTEKEIAARDDQFAEMLSKSKTVVVNALSVKNDIEKFYGKHKCKVIALPFCPVINMNFFEERSLVHYALPNNYFMISNQFWKHKDHRTAIIAFGNFLKDVQDKDIGLVCTGQTDDDRFPEYFNELKKLISTLGLDDKIQILGYIPKDDQLAILKNAIGVIQPTLFEGGPGGGAIYDSVAYGIPSIVSDIAVNMEINDETVTFFKTGSSSDLALKMHELFAKPKLRYTMDYLRKKNKIALRKMGDEIMKVVSLEKSI